MHVLEKSNRSTQVKTPFQKKNPNTQQLSDNNSHEGRGDGTNQPY